jgi:hypothetical protein
MTVNSGNIIILIIIILTLDLSAQDEITPTVKLEGKWKIDLNFSDEFDGKKLNLNNGGILIHHGMEENLPIFLDQMLKLKEVICN